MSSLLARTGRLRQRYEDNVRLVSGCIPYRFIDSSIEMEKRIQVLMVSSPNRTDLVFPKGGWEDDETMLEAASREALEEAGVRGILRESPLGVWQFRSKSRQDDSSSEGGCRGVMFALQVTEELETWPEHQNRGRKWLNIEEAFELCRYEWMREALEKFMRVMEEEVMICREMEEPGNTPAAALADVVAECSIMTSNCCILQPSSGQRHGMNGIIHQFSWQIPLERLPLT